MRIAVIGAGAGGLCAARHALAAGHDVIVFEQTAQLGGTWAYEEQVGTDEFGLPIFSSMYQGLRYLRISIYMIFWLTNKYQIALTEQTFRLKSWVIRTIRYPSWTHRIRRANTFTII